MTAARKYAFAWELLGDIAAGRPHLGDTVRLESYRLMMFTFRDVLEQRYGADEADRIFCEAGRVAGRQFYEHTLTPAPDFQAFVRDLQGKLREFGIGILRIEQADEKKGEFVLTVAEDLDCSGLPESDTAVCTYDEGFIAALLEGFTGRPFKVKEVDCWSTGGRICRFAAKMVAD